MLLPGEWLLGRDAGRAFTYHTPAVREYQYFYLNTDASISRLYFHVQACYDVLILLKSEVCRMKRIRYDVNLILI